MKKSTRVFTNTDEIHMTPFNTQLKIGELIKGYVNNSLTDEGGVTTMNGRNNIRPKYQRSYVAENNVEWRVNLINSILCGFPINRIYIGVDENSNNDYLNEADWETLDGQQRTITICEFCNDNFPIIYNGYETHFSNLRKDLQERILDYELDITICKGSQDARIAWFKRINQPNSILVPQELRNATYIGEWLEHNKKYFSSPSANIKKQVVDKTEKYCALHYTSSRKIERSELLELAFDWVSYYVYPDYRKKSADERICKYMAEHQHDTPNDDVINHYKKVIDWVNETFLNFDNDSIKKYVQSVQGVEWGRLYAEYSQNHYDGKYISKRVKTLLEIQSCFNKPSGLYEWVIRGEHQEDSNLMGPRNFKKEDIQRQYEAQGGEDPFTGERLPLEEMEAHHIIPWCEGGTIDRSNLVLCSKETHRKLHNGELNREQVRERRDELMSSVSKRIRK